VTNDLGETLVWNAKVESMLYHRHRIWAQRVGPAKAGGPRSRKLPAVLMPEQAAYVFGYGSGPLSVKRERTMRDVVHDDLVNKGYVVSHACRYGGDYVIYEAHPSVCHSSDTIRVIEPDEEPSAIDVAAYCRVQGSVLKRAVFATVLPKTGKPAYVGITYNPALSTDTAKKTERRLSRRIVESPRGPNRTEDDDDDDLGGGGGALGGPDTPTSNMDLDDDDDDEVVGMRTDARDDFDAPPPDEGGLDDDDDDVHAEDL